MTQRDQLFWNFMKGIIVVMALFGAGMAIASFFSSEVIALRWLSTFGSMFTGVLGLGSGYLLGSRNGNGNHKEKS